ncbi:hypothetical protein O59_004294 [Cellvibrio sp. BR]|uniref:hypothetical protein n=1 Tax=Cellvibrio sp. BR TaxID=1134474 RepID=UPI0002600D94|nr:hypothetical protein [Cellvibrio sp. BR]EIK42976.1 hypothetical protein O59_004294 [Cellvibrio sp. BR]
MGTVVSIFSKFLEAKEKNKNIQKEDIQKMKLSSEDREHLRKVFGIKVVQLKS